MKTLTNLNYLIMFSALFLKIDCSKTATEPVGTGEPAQTTNAFLTDSLATRETVALFKNLQSLAKTKVLFGHQDDTAYGVDWWDQPNRSDVKETCGDYPAVYGWDLGDIQNRANLDGVDFARMKELIKEAFIRGGINTITMHLDNPVTAENAWDNTPAVRYILPGQAYYARFLKTLELIANFLKDLRTADGIYIPIIFRPYHEHNHDWSWWGKQSCTVEEYNALWRMTVEYLRDTQNIHHLLYAISPQEVTTTGAYLERYPGDNYVDLFGLDYYRLWDKSNISELGGALKLISDLAESRGKVPALTEVGVEKVPVSTWWTEYLLAAITSNDQSKNIAWALVWRNASKDHHFGPYPGHASAADFRRFYNDPLIVFEKGLPDVYR